MSATSLRRAGAIVCMVSLALVCGAEPASFVLEVTLSSSGLNLTARDAPLGEVLTAIGRQTGITIVLRGNVRTPVTETFANVPFDQAIRRLTRWHSVVLVYDQAINRPDNVVLTEVRVTDSASGWSSVGPDMASETRIANQQSEAVAHDLRRHAMSEGRNRQLEMALKQTTSRTASKLIETLVHERCVPVTVKSLRTTAMTHADPDVRRGAIKVLASLSSRDATNAVRATLNDAHPDVRTEALIALRQLERTASGKRSGQ